jgi:hypothetical protein
VPVPIRPFHPVFLALCLVLGSGLVAPGVLAGQEGVGGGSKPGLAEPVELQCRLGDGPWQNCQMRVVALGLSWQLLLDGEQIGFQHDGKGNVRMQRAKGSWEPVQANWNAEAALCWNGVCARGDLPLD